jgi:PAS domain S-box-containing protein
VNSKPKSHVLWFNVSLVLLLASLLLAATLAFGQTNLPARVPETNKFLQKLTKQEREWLRKHPIIRVVQDPGWPPVEFSDDLNVPSGMSADYLDIIEKKIGVKFERVRGLSWQEAYSRLKRWDIDMTTSVAVTPERTKFWAFTKPYMKIPIIIATQPSVTYIGDMRELNGKKIAVVDGYAVNDWMARDFPEVQQTRVKTALDGLESLQRGEVFAYIDNLLVVGYYQAKMQVTGIKIAGQTPYINAQAMAVRKDWKPLAGILQKALDSISLTERNDIYRKWLPIRYEYGSNYTLFWQISLIFVVILLALVIRNWRLAKEIKSRKAAEEALRISESLFRLLAENSTDMIARHDIQGRFLYVSPACRTLVGYEPEKLVGHLAFEFVHPDDIPKVDQSRLSIIDQPVLSTTEFRMLCKNGQYIWLETISKIITNKETGDVLEIHASSRDITERRNTEEALRASEERYSLVNDSSRDSIYSYDTSGRFTSANRNLCETLRMDASQIIGHTHAELGFPESLCEEWDELHRLVYETGSTIISETAAQIPGGEIRDYEVVLNPLHDENGIIIGIGGTTRDITERKRAQEEIKKLNMELEKRVAQRTLQLETTNKELEAFCYSVSHDLRAPLRAMDGFSKAILEDCGTLLDEHGQDYLQRVRVAAGKMSSLIDDLLKLSRLNRETMTFKEVNLSNLVAVIISNLRQIDPERRADFIIEPGVVVKGDERLLAIMLENLLDNAWKFTKYQPNAVIEFGICRLNGEPTYYVSDNGVGFDMTYVDKLFGAFQRLHSADEFPGTGIGLATVQRIINRHGGRIWAESQLGKGAVFNFALQSDYAADKFESL